MITFLQRRRSSNWIRMAWLIGLMACLGCSSQTPETAPDHAGYIDGCHLLARGQLAEAVAVFDRIIATNPQHALAFFSRANAYQRLGQKELAINDYAHAIRVDKEITETGRVPSFPLRGDLAEAYFNHATLLNATDKPDEVIADLTETLRLNPKHSDAYCRRGMAFLNKGFPELAVDDLSEAIRLSPNSHEPVCQRARAWLKAGKYSETIKDARLAIRLNAKCGNAYRILGVATLSSLDQQSDRAIQYFEEAIRLDKNLAVEVNPALAQAYFDWATRLEKAGKLLDAEEAFRRAEELDPKYVDRDIDIRKDDRLGGDARRLHKTSRLPLPDPKLIIQATDALDQKEYDEAIARFTNIVNIDPTCADAWYGRGVAFLKKGLPGSATKDFDKAIRYRPDFAQAYGQRSRAYTELGDDRRAIQDATEAIQLKPDLALAYLHRGIAYSKENSFEHALVDLQEAEKLDSALKDQAREIYADVYRKQGTCLLGQRRWSEAIASWEKVIPSKSSTDKPLARLLAQAHRERGFNDAEFGEFEKAMRDFNKAMELDQNNANNHHLCGLACCKMARACHDRGLIADEKKQWEFAVNQLRRASWLAPELRDSLRRALADAQLNLDAIDALPQTTKAR